MSTLILTRRVGEKFYVCLPDGTVVEVMLWATKKSKTLSPNMPRTMEDPSWFDGTASLKFEMKEGQGVEITASQSDVNNPNAEKQRQETVKNLRDHERRKQRQRNETTYRKRDR